MKLEKSIKVTLTQAEIESIKTTAQIFREVCNEFNDCEGCPFMGLCDQCGSYPHIYLEDFIRNSEKTLDK